MFKINTKGTDYFVGDLHGCLSQFYDKLAKVDFNFDNDRVFCVGDLIDRGPDSEKCLRLIEKDWFFSIKGNHEDMMLGGQPYHIWMNNGGDWINSVEDTDSLKKLATSLPLTMEISTEWGRVGVVHADAIGTWNDLDEGSFYEPALIWGRCRIRSNNTTIVKGIDLVVVGHTPVKKVVKLGNVVYIDTGAVYDEGFLTLINAKDLFGVLHSG